ncbi:ABC transporter ATP-binding protein [Patescibacteria group bacterium]|nr:ABC transporter ATP-binding protein [Patescibacteria group bacterium]MBU1705540.1 ABC transporter ATP-binding protein [Patescibacteria group bacterium]
MAKKGAPVISLKDIHKEFATGDVVTKVLFGVTFDIEPGEFVAIMGPSGSGKSTLMHIMGFLDRLTEGDYFFNGQKVSDLSDDELALMRRHEVGFVFQFFYLLPNSKVIDNILLPMVYQEVPYARRMREAKAVLKQVGLEHRMDHLSNQLSGGERQRVAIARAMVGEPSVIFADEPTGNLDSKTGESILRLLQDLNDQGKTVIMVTHELEAAQFAKRIIRVRDGLISSDEKQKAQRRKSFNK